jgi:hypothetical protein
MNLTVVLTGASGAVFGREILRAGGRRSEFLILTSSRPEMRAVGATFVSPALQRGVGKGITVVE